MSDSTSVELDMSNLDLTESSKKSNSDLKLNTKRETKNLTYENNMKIFSKEDNHDDFQTPIKHKELFTQCEKNVKSIYQDKVRKIIDKIPDNRFISSENAKCVIKLLEDVVKCFNTSMDGLHRKRLSRVLLGSKNTGKSTIVKDLKCAIQSVYEESVLIYIDSNELVVKKTYSLFPYILNQVKEKYEHIELNYEGDNMSEFLSCLNQKCPDFKLLIILDEFQEIYIKKSDEEIRYNEFDYVQKLIVELKHISESVGCVGWLTGSSQTLRSLYSTGKHYDYYGIYCDLNGKKYRLSYWLTLQSNDIQSFFKITNGEDITPEAAKTRYMKFGGAMGDLASDTEMQTSVMENWSPFVWKIIFQFASKYKDNSLQEFKEMHFSELKDIVDSTIKNCNSWSTRRCVDEIQVLCDQYVIENRGEDTYCIGHPGYISNYSTLVEKYASNISSTKRYLEMRQALESK